ncbi:ATP-binding protein [Streptomyces albulus]|nr:ATP-binding protein [Streptomyces noursei]
MTTQLHGRDDELRTLREMIGRLPGTGGVLTVLGEPGIGKTTLLRAAVAAAEESGAVALETTGVEAEARVPFAGLHQLLRPVMAGVGRLPAPQRIALQSAFGVVDGPVPEVSMVAFAVLNLLAEAAEDAPLLLALDDAQWLDAPTQEALAFVARRVSRDPILVVAALHKGHAGPFTSLGAADLDLAGLDDSTARHVLAEEAGDLSLPLRERILREARGNPLALVELPVAWRDQREAAQQATPGFLPLTARLERAFAGRAAELPADSRDVLLVAAVDHADDLSEILAAASVLAGRTLTVEALDAAVAARLLRLEGLRLLFHHPLVRSAVQMSETLTRRLSANAALAEVLADEPYRRTWHLAQSIIGPDDDIADELVANRAISLRRGGTAMAAWELERSAQLTSDHAKRGRRLLLACEHAFGLGRADQVERLLRAAERSGLTTLDRARLEWLRSSPTTGARRRAPGAAAVRDRAGIGGRGRRPTGVEVAVERGPAVLVGRCRPGRQGRGGLGSGVVGRDRERPAPSRDPRRGGTGTSRTRRARLVVRHGLGGLRRRRGVTDARYGRPRDRGPRPRSGPARPGRTEAP